MNFKNNVLNILGILICFVLFGLSMVLVSEVPFLTMTGIIGLCGVHYFVYRLVSTQISHNDN
ncbi:hypothetical protein [Alkalihalobacillus sp. R86527]|uniref:hypothetical protein n=1 Tax=Alkalihalobacillus sp. R86527 TaxID=3093863 RepID=UPI00366D0A91